MLFTPEKLTGMPSAVSVAPFKLNVLATFAPRTTANRPVAGAGGKVHPQGQIENAAVGEIDGELVGLVGRPDDRHLRLPACGLLQDRPLVSVTNCTLAPFCGGASYLRRRARQIDRLYGHPAMITVSVTASTRRL